ncbi:MAG TPA: NERD domain-containing protein/DEAD/DEAH box helicase [Ilumatobacteraceae bacterium]|nr:NERD domain-containing protein/DEAD/DEAH box helicase [Ilumatobacteraceae bacterium]
MATLLPADFDLTLLPTSEQRVCKAFLLGLDATWFVVPSVPIVVDGTDCEIDVVLVSPHRGVIAVEVKGGVISIEKGRWIQNGYPLSKSPTQQITKAKHNLMKRLRSTGVELEGMFVCHAVALPDVGSVPPGGLGPDTPAETVFAKPQLEFPTVAVNGLLREHGPIPPERIARLLAALRPDIALEGDEGQVLQWAGKQLDAETRVHLANVCGLDKNHRVLVTGGAGTGKTMLVIDWAKRAIRRGERTAVVCFNKPIADQLQRSLAGTDAMVGTYHDIAVRLLEPHGFRVGASPTPEYWLNVPTDALAFHTERIGTPFDTIIVDEGQDIYPQWFESLERLLDPRGPRNLLVVADPAQAIYVRPWTPPADMMELPMVYNLRNCGAIAKLVQRLGGPAPLPSAPYGDAVVHRYAGGHKEVRKRVRDAVHELSQTYGIPFSQIAVLTTHTNLRDALLDGQIDGCPLVRWADRSEDSVLCETVHRTKGLERTAVILVDMSGEPDKVLLYVGVSRAVSVLRLVGPQALAHAVGVPAAPSAPGPK